MKSPLATKCVQSCVTPRLEGTPRRVTLDDTAVIEVLTRYGPLTGAELSERTGGEPLALWRLCVSDPRIAVCRVGQRYLRLDRAVNGYARLSPSIRREFLTYALVDLAENQERLYRRARDLSAEIVEISDAKRRLTHKAVESLMEGVAERDEILSQVCFVLAGDITYNMAHRVPRPERSTGKMVRGSDLDVVIITADDFPPRLRSVLDDAVYEKKYMLLINPSYQEELDYLIKDLSMVKKQMGFDTFEHMVACKILDEGEFLYGNREIFATVKSLLAREDIPRRLELLVEKAAANRTMGESILKQEGGELPGSHYLNLFFTTDEGDEIY